MEQISLKQMFEELIDCILNRKELCTYYWKRENEFIQITQVDIMDSRFKMADDDFSEYDWELESNNIYKNIENKQ